MLTWLTASLNKYTGSQ